MAEYDLAGAAIGQAAQMQPEEREMARLRRIISTAEATNYDGDPEYYQQIKSIAMQAGVPIKQFKTNPFRLAKTAGMSMLDMAAMGLIPNEWYEPMNTAEQVASGIGGAAAFALPWGAAAGARKIAMGGIGALGKGSRSILNKAMGQGRFKQASQAWQGFGKGTPRAKPGTFMGGAAPKPKPKAPKPKGGSKTPPTSRWTKPMFVTEIKKLVKAAKKQKLNLSLANQKLFANIKNLTKSQLQKLLAAARKLG